MKTKEKNSHDLVQKFIDIPFCKDFGGMDLELAKQCAEIAQTYFDKFKQPEPEPIKRNKYGVIKQLKALNKVACDFCLYENSKETEPCRNCTDRIGIYEYYKRD